MSGLNPSGLGRSGNFGAVDTERLSPKISFATTDIQAAVNRLDNGGEVICTQSVTLSERIELSDNVTLRIPEGVEVTAEVGYSPTTTNVNGREVASLITNADHTNGNSNVHVVGNGRVSAEGASLDDTQSWAGVWLDKCDNSSVSGLEVDNILFGISQDGGSTGNERYHAVFFTECTKSDIENVEAHHTGDDCISVRRSSQNVNIANCEAYQNKFGHGIQAVQASIFGQPDVTEDIKVSRCLARDGANTNTDNAGIAFHNVQDSTTVNNTIRRTGSGILYVENTSSVKSSNDFIDLETLGDYGIKFLDTANLNASDVTIDNPTVLNVNTVGIHCFASTGGTIENVTITAPDIREEFLVGISVSDPNGTVNDVGIHGGNIDESVRASATAVTFGNTVFNCRCIGVRATVGGVAFEETDNCNFNQFIGNNGRSSGTSTPQTVGANTVSANNL